MTTKHAFRSAPEFEERLCTSCQRKGDPDPYWPIEGTYWPVIHGRFCFYRCKACVAESSKNWRARKAAANDDQALEAA